MIIRKEQDAIKERVSSLKIDSSSGKKKGISVIYNIPVTAIAIIGITT